MTDLPIGTQPRVTICAATYRRPEGLRKLLGSIDRLAFETVPEPALTMLVVDNNPEGDAAPVVEAMRARFRWPLLYAHEMRPGVSFARNRGLDESRDADLVAFVDDDEWVHPLWLDELLAIRAATGAAAVVGPVHPVFAGSVPGWIDRGGFFQPRAHGDRAPVDYGWSGNCLVCRRTIEAEGLRFDEALSLSGGEDSLFFDTLHRRGHGIRWSQNARVWEDVPAARTRLGWLARRWYRTGITDATIRVRRGSTGAAARAVNLARGLLRMTVGGAALVASLPAAPFAPHVCAARLYTVCRGAGMIAWVLGRNSAALRR